MQARIYFRALENGAAADAFPPELRGALGLLLRKRVYGTRTDVTEQEEALVHALERAWATRCPAPAERATTLARILLIGS